MRFFAVLTFSVLLLGTRWGIAKDGPEAKPALKPPQAGAKPPPGTKADAAPDSPASKKPVKPAAADAKPTAADAKPARPTADEIRVAEEEALHQTGVSYVTAFCNGDAKAVADHFTEDAEYVDEQNRAYIGRPAIAESLKAFFAENPDCKLDLHIDSIRFISPGVAIEDGRTTVIRSARANT